MSKLTIDITSQDQKTIVTMSGIIDQTFRFEARDQLKTQEIVFNFEKIQLINSLGVREMILFLNSLSDKKLVFEKCPVILVNQFNMVRGLMPANCQVKSFFAPYYAPIDHEDMELLLDATEIKNGKAPQKNHPQSDEKLVFDDLEDRYFHFLQK